MTQKKKITIATASTVLFATACIFGGQYMANKIAADRASQIEVTAQTSSLQDIAKQTASLSVPEDIPEETTVYDENGNVAIEPEPVDTETVTEQPKESTATTTATVEPEQPTTPKATPTEPKAEPKKETTSKPAAKAPSEPKPVATPKEEPAPKNDTSSDKQSSSDSNEGKVYVPGFGYMESEGEGAAIPVTYEGDHNEIIGH